MIVLTTGVTNKKLQMASSLTTKRTTEQMDKHDIPILGNFYTKHEVDEMISAALAEARAIDEASMAKHNRDATIISMVLGFTCLALFVDGLLRILGIVPPFAGLDVNILDDIAEKTKIIVENDISQSVLNKINQRI
tara:strand:- start:1904 stop:2311 length:408 start_codon:yes stop_codon:yes gene_type:complete